MIIGSRLIYSGNTESTNTFASHLLKSEPVADGTVIHTNFQTAGRGQKGNSWVSEADKNLLFSIVLFPDIVLPEDQFIISMFISLGICDFLKVYINNCKIKWPNDIYAGDDKISGILIENSLAGNKILSSVAGIGLNVNQTKFPDVLPNPISLKMITGRDYNIDSSLKELLKCLDMRYKELLSGHRGKIREEYISSLYAFDTWRNFRTGSEILYGKIIGVSDFGRLQIADRWNKTQEFSFRDVDFII